MAEKCGDFGGKNRQGQPCGKAAGWGVPETVTGKCRRCRRYGAGRPPSKPETIVARAVTAQSDLAKRAQTLKASGVDLLDLTDTVAILRVLLDDVSSKHARENELDTRALALVLACVESTRKTVETIERVKHLRAFGESDLQIVVGVLEVVFGELTTVYTQARDERDFDQLVKARVFRQLSALKAGPVRMLDG